MNDKIRFNETVQKYMKLHHLTMKQLGEKVGRGESTVSMWIAGKSTPPMGVVQQLADLFNVTTDEMIYGYSLDYNSAEDELAYKSAHVAYIKVPLYSSLCCGDGGFVDDNILDYVAVPSANLSDSLEYFAQYAEGNSMIDAGIESGDLLVFQKTPSINSGDIGCFCIDENEATCKKLKKQGDTIILQPMNTGYDPIIIDVLNNHFAILGKLKKIIKDVQ